MIRSRVMPFFVFDIEVYRGLEINTRSNPIEITSTTMISIRDAISTDAHDLAQLIKELGYSAEARDVWARVEKLPDTYRTLVAVLEGQVVGFIGLLTLPVYEHPRPIGWILALSVSSTKRRIGIGRALIAAAEKHYRALSINDVRLSSGLQRTEAHDFYDRLGFDKVGYRFKKNLS
jgi:ribosomal protein S18 acetylase RimI-like enzyme